MIARFSLVLLFAAGPTPGLSIGVLQVKVGHPEAHADHRTSLIKAVEVTASGSTLPSDDQLIRTQTSLEENDAEDDPVEAASVDAVDAAAANVDTTSLCGQTCKDVIGGGAPCAAFYGSGCKGTPPPGFHVESTLYEMCPFACGPKPEETVTSWIWLYVLLGLFSPLTFFALLAGIIRICAPKRYEIWAGRLRQIQKSFGARYEAWKYNSNYEYEEWEDEDWGEEYEEDDMAETMNEDGASKSMMDDEGASQSNIMAGASQSMMDDAGASQSMSVDEQATTVMGGTTMMPTMMGEQATTMMDTTVMGSDDAMATTMMGSNDAVEPAITMVGSSSDSL